MRNKKWIAILLTVCMLLSMLPATVFAEEGDDNSFTADPLAEGEAAAQVDNVKYTTLTAAFGAVATAADKTVKLLRDVDYTEENNDTAMAVDVSGVTIDLNGYTVTTGYTGGGDPLLILLGDFTLKNGKVQAKGDYGIFTGNVAGAVDPNKVAKIENVEVLGGGVNAGSAVELTNVTATGNTYYAVWSESNGVVIKSGNYSSNGAAVLGISSQHGSMTVEGGTFTAKENQRIVLSSGGAPLIKGGTFNKDMTNENATLDEGLEWTEGTDGEWTVTEKQPEPELGPAAKDGFNVTYDTLQKAIDAVGMYDNLTLLRDVTEDITIESGKGPAIKLDEHMLHTAATVKSGGYLRFEDYNFTTNGTDTATWVTNNGDSPIVTVEAGGTFELSQGGMAGDVLIQNNGGTVELTMEAWLDGTVNGGVQKVYSSTKFSEAAKNSIGEISGKEWLSTAAPGDKAGNWYIVGTAAIEVGSKKYGYSDLQLAIDEAGGNETVKLLSNVTASVVVGADKKITLDLNGKKLEGAKPSVKNQEPTLKNLGELTITGGGTIKANSNSRFDGDTVVNEGKLTIENGTFQTKSGHVSLKNNADKSNVIVKAGKFAEDISEIATPGEGLQFTADGKGVEEKLDETNAAAKVVKGEGTTYYKTLQAAVNVAPDGEAVTVTLLKGIKESVTIAAGKNIVLELNGQTLTNDPAQYSYQAEANRKYQDTLWVQKGATLTINGEGRVENQTNQAQAVFNEGTAILNGGTYARTSAAGYVIVNHGTKMTIGTGVEVTTCDNGSALVVNGYMNEKPSSDPSVAGNTRVCYCDTDESRNVQNPVMEITGGTFTGGKHTVSNDHHGRMTISGNPTVTAAADDKNAFRNEPTATAAIKGGTFTGNVVDNDAANRALQISGGTYSIEIPASYCADGFLPVKGENGGCGVKEEALTITASPASRTGAGTVTLTVTPAGLLGVVTVTCGNENITVTEGEDGTWTASLPGTAATYTFTVTLGEGEDAKTAQCTVSVTRRRSSKPKQPQEEIQEPDVPLAQPFPFEDVPEHEWYYDAVKFAFDNGIMNGTGETSFAPNSVTTRAAIVTILYRMENEPEAAAASFEDVEAGEWYTDAIGWAAANGIVQGYNATTFGPDDAITREQMAAILFRYAAHKGYDVTVGGELDRFADAADASDYALKSLSWAVGHLLVNGSNGSLLPQDNATRAQIAQVIMNFCETLAKEKA